MRSSTRKADGARVPLLVLGLVLAACTAATGAAAVGDHSTDAAEKHRVNAFALEDHRLDRVEAIKGGASSR